MCPDTGLPEKRTSLNSFPHKIVLVDRSFKITKQSIWTCVGPKIINLISRSAEIVKLLFEPLSTKCWLNYANYITFDAKIYLYITSSFACGLTISAHSYLEYRKNESILFDLN